jgi:thiol-disulfide isomerase/thioredoxin
MKLALRFCVSLALLIGMGACTSSDKPIQLSPGNWRFSIALQDSAQLPFLADLKRSESGDQWIIHNAEERIVLDEVEQQGDSIVLKLPVFQSEFRAKMVGPDHITGWWYEYSRGADYRIAFEAKQGDFPRFPAVAAIPTDPLAPKWEVIFGRGTVDSVYAIGEFSQTGSKVVGTFLTETGDYRFLEGTFDGKQLQLSAFDGSHAFLFEAELSEGQFLGTFYSGNHWVQAWEAVPDSDVRLRSPEALTYLKPGYEQLAFAFPEVGEAGEMLALTDERFRGKVVIVQLLGSWCPNCLDESKLFAKWYQQYHEQGLEIVGLAYERSGDSLQSIQAIQRMKDRLKIPYPILLAAITDDKLQAGESLPMLNQILSFPTSLYLDRQGQIRKIHTGFYGSGTGAHHLRFVEEYTAFLEKLLAEQAE